MAATAPSDFPAAIVRPKHLSNVRRAAPVASAPPATARPCSITRLGDELDPMLAAPLALAIAAAGLSYSDVGAALTELELELDGLNARLDEIVVEAAAEFSRALTAGLAGFVGASRS